MRFVADTGPLVAWVDRSEATHGLMSRILADIAPYLLVPDVVVAEVDALLRRRVSTAAARSLLEAFESRALRRVSLDESLFNRAIQYENAYADLDLGLVDASVMALAEKERAPILTFDFRDFLATRPIRGGSWRLVLDERGLFEA